MNNLQKRQLKILEDTIAYYAINPKAKRCMGEDGGCTYDGKTTGKDTDGCAVGRLLSPRLRAKLDSLYADGAVVSTVFKLLPKKIQSLGEDFLVELQGLHDHSPFWNKKKGLSEEGKKRVLSIKASFNLN